MSSETELRREDVARILSEATQWESTIFATDRDEVNEVAVRLASKVRWLAEDWLKLDVLMEAR